MEVKVVTTKQQLQQALLVRERVFVQEQQCPPELEFDSFDTLGACPHFIVQHQGLVIATSRLVPYQGSKSTCKFERIAVDKQYRMAGCGNLLLNQMSSTARELGFSQVIIHAQIQAEAFYLKNGFVRTEKHPFVEANIMHCQMKKNLFA